MDEKINRGSYPTVKVPNHVKINDIRITEQLLLQLIRVHNLHFSEIIEDWNRPIDTIELKDGTVIINLKKTLFQSSPTTTTEDEE